MRWSAFVLLSAVRLVNMSWLKLWPVTSWSVIVIISLGVTAVIGDQSVSRCNSSFCRAFADSCTHCFIGLLTWLALSLNFKYGSVVQFYEACACGLLASLIDVDHFIAAKSLKLKDATTLSSRPFLHCTSILFFLCVIHIALFTALNFKGMTTLSWILLGAILSHHIRDATRRGLWIWPFGSTPPIPYYIYIILIMLLPVILMLTMTFFNAPPKASYVLDV